MCDVERTAGEAEMVRRQAVCGIARCLDSRPVNRVTDPTRTATGSARIQLLLILGGHLARSCSQPYAVVVGIQVPSRRPQSQPGVGHLRVNVTLSCVFSDGRIGRGWILS